MKQWKRKLAILLCVLLALQPMPVSAAEEVEPGAQIETEASETTAPETTSEDEATKEEVPEAPEETESSETTALETTSEDCARRQNDRGRDAGDDRRRNAAS